jgi:hypothetical protein
LGVACGQVFEKIAAKKKTMKKRIFLFCFVIELFFLRSLCRQDAVTPGFLQINC